MMTLPEMAAVLFSAASAVIMIFHLLLALGLPLGDRAMGGKYPGKWPVYMRFMALLIICFWILISLVVLIQAGLVFTEYQSLLRSFGWLIILFTGIQVILHATTPSPKERQVWLPVTIILLGCSLAVVWG